MDQVSENPFQHKYIVKLKSDVPRDCNMAVLFPNHPVEKKRVLWTVQYTSCKALNTEINRRLQESSRQDLIMAVACGDTFYCFRGFVGNLYLIWAERVSQQTINKHENDIGENIPVLIETNGQMRYRSVFIFLSGETRATAMRDLQWFDPFLDEIFCCETDVRADRRELVPTVSNSFADQVTRDPVVRSIVSLDDDRPPFSEEDDGELMDVDSSRQLNYELPMHPAQPDESIN